MSLNPISFKYGGFENDTGFVSPPIPPAPLLRRHRQIYLFLNYHFHPHYPRHHYLSIYDQMNNWLEIPIVVYLI